MLQLKLMKEVTQSAKGQWLTCLHRRMHPMLIAEGWEGQPPAVQSVQDALGAAVALIVRRCMCSIVSGAYWSQLSAQGVSRVCGVPNSTAQKTMEDAEAHVSGVPMHDKPGRVHGSTRGSQLLSLLCCA